jgi:gp45 sliding clamp, C terminal
MKLSENTLAVLKNFASINSGVVLGAGKTQKTISPEKSILVEATLDDDIPTQFGIYDLNQFLGNLTTLRNPELTFAKDTVTLDDGELSFDYRACSANLIITPPEKDLVLKTVDVKFSLPNDTLQKLIKVATMNSLPNLSVVGKNGALLLKIHERANDTSNSGTIKIGEYAGQDFTASFKTDNLKLLPNDYNVEIQKGAFAKFENTAGTLKYFVALETK